MPLSIAFRWKTPNIQVAKNAMEQNGWTKGLSDVADSIKYAGEMRYRKEQDKRRNAIEDEDRQRRMEWEDKQRAVYGQAADTIRGMADQRAALVARQQELQQKLNALKAQLGM